MKILVSNDDGIFAEGIRTLAGRLAKDHDVYVCAPDRERSATGHSMSVHKPLMVSPIRQNDFIEGIVDGCMTSGTPADCVKIAIFAVWKDIKFDFFISGINHGPNLGVDVLYSGTVSAAMEAMLGGLPSIASSLYSYSSKEFGDAANWIAEFINKNPETIRNIPKKTFLNLNIPAGPASGYEGMEITRLGNRAYEENFEERMDPRGRKYFWLAGNPIEGLEVKGTDGMALLEHKVSITPVKFNMTDFETCEYLKDGLDISGVFG
jgi:5'-nucleotidase